jgi:hypothetical protein
MGVCLPGSAEISRYVVPSQQVWICSAVDCRSKFFAPGLRLSVISLNERRDPRPMALRFVGHRARLGRAGILRRGVHPSRLATACPGTSTVARSRRTRFGSERTTAFISGAGAGTRHRPAWPIWPDGITCLSICISGSSWRGSGARTAAPGRSTSTSVSDVRLALDRLPCAVRQQQADPLAAI